MASHLKGVKKSTLTDAMRKALCEYKNEHLSSSQKDLQQWVQQTFDLSISQSIISHTPKKHKSTKYPKLEKKVSMTVEMIQTKTKEFLQKIFNFSIGWLEQFKARRGIKSYKIFDTLPQIRAKLESFDWKDIYNMDETSLFYHYEKGEINPEKINVLDAIHFINATWNIDVKPTIIANCFRHCKIRFEEDMPLEQEIGDVEGIHKLKEVISYLHYRNAMDVEQTLNYPSETESLIESSMDEEIIQGVMDVSADDEQDLDDSSVLPHVSPKKAFLAVDTLKNYLIQHEKNIPNLIYALLKVKNEIVFDSHAKKKQLTIYTYFSKE
ncbi:hypothetical protein ES288_A08G201200v1 [Gossypium darwinii]|uniref:HTH CENPB-type domain-containing protein n=1 Tax=Gossypium darwinii TaxID=34276 RepID=A0A5D2FLM8_GOSDA|nr:hypothetical protein ES288_A08G201200v1 [Gossypium darwinii]